MQWRMMSMSHRAFVLANTAFLTAVSVACLLPIIHIVAVSLSAKEPANANLVGVIPVGLTFQSYAESFHDMKLMRALMQSVYRVLLGVTVNMLLTICVAYPLSFFKEEFPGRNLYLWFVFITMLVSGGLIPYYILIKELGLINSMWALVLPGIPVFNVIILMNFFRQLPRELKESAFMDGASYPVILTRIYLPLSTPALATLVLFCFIGHWNSWFDGLIYMNKIELYPLQTYLQTLVQRMNTSPNLEEAKRLAFIARRSLLFSKVFIAIIPIILIYPFVQKYYQKGLIIGSVKG